MLAQHDIRGDQPARPGGGMDPRPIDAATVRIGDFYDDTPGAMGGGYAQGSLYRLALARRSSGFRSRDRWHCDHMGQWIDEALDHRAIHFGRFALDDEIDLFARCRFHFAHQAGQSLEKRPQRLSADGHDAVLKLSRQLMQAHQGAGPFR